MTFKEYLGQRVSKLEFGTDEADTFYYTVPFVQDDALIVCTSSQVGCPMRCSFCATGDRDFLWDLTQEQILEQILSGFKSGKKLQGAQDAQRAKVIAEGMGDAGFNIENLVYAFKEARDAHGLEDQYKRLDFGMSTIGHLTAAQQYAKLVQNDSKSHVNGGNSQYDFQLSLHSPFDEERQYLLTMGSFPLQKILAAYVPVAQLLKQPFKFNYLVLNNRTWQNYDETHLEALDELFDDVRSRGLEVKLKLTDYSETGKRYSSPPTDVILQMSDRFQKNGIDAYYKPLAGRDRDIQGACGQLHYEVTDD